jgi:hypothetical protein
MLNTLLAAVVAFSFLYLFCRSHVFVTSCDSHEKYASLSKVHLRIGKDRTVLLETKLDSDHVLKNIGSWLHHVLHIGARTYKLALRLRLTLHTEMWRQINVR